MGNCPVCNGRVADDFGLMECENCGAQLIVHVDGRVEYSGNQEASQVMPPIPEAVQELPENLTPEPESVPDLPPDEPMSDPEFAAMEELAGDDEPGVQATPEDLPAELGGEVAPEKMFDGNEPELASEATKMYQAGPPANSPDLSDLAAFANSSESGGREGPLRYNLEVTGIDTSDVREAFREAITDRKFMWDTDQILRSIRHGEVNIINVSPGKAYMLISRLRNLPVRVKWEQHAITQP